MISLFYNTSFFFCIIVCLSFLIGLKSKRDPGDPVGSNHGIYEECCYWRKANAIHNWFSKRYIREGNPWGYYSVPVHELEGLLVWKRSKIIL